MNKIVYSVIMFFFSYNCYCLPSESFYNIDSNAIDINNKLVNLRDLSGRINILSMVYTNCKSTCPLIISNMKRIQYLIPKGMEHKVIFTLISLDPDRDTTKNIRRFFASKRLNSKWNILVTNKTETLKIATALGIKVKKESDGEYTHSNLIVVLDDKGVIQFKHPALDKNISKIIRFIRKFNI
jgi:protein SCO1/2